MKSTHSLSDMASVITREIGLKVQIAYCRYPGARVIDAIEYGPNSVTIWVANSNQAHSCGISAVVLRNRVVGIMVAKQNGTSESAIFSRCGASAILEEDSNHIPDVSKSYVIDTSSWPVGTVTFEAHFNDGSSFVFKNVTPDTEQTIRGYLASFGRGAFGLCKLSLRAISEATWQSDISTSPVRSDLIVCASAGMTEPITIPRDAAIRRGSCGDITHVVKDNAWVSWEALNN